ncbi:EFR1 family ferrodoxin [Pelosinus sp. sgz500959]|uniref:EFR1 family ferrodoxin n=1 Tax=Pelosinus sp. sgz500959 TaxID=3242472 RepID=UPI0036723A86
MAFEKMCVFFMTGTGNSYKIAAWCSEVAKTFDLQTKMQQITTDKLAIELGEKILCIFTFPTHGFTAPWLIVKQILYIPRGKGTSAVVLASRAGIRIKGISLPGMEGTAGYLITCLLFLKGYKVRGVIGIDMPSNWTAVHWGLSKENIEFIISAAQPKVKHFAKVILSGQVYFDGIVSLVLGLWLAPISFMYLIMAQLIFSKLFFASDQCIGCSLCVNSCPKHAIIMKGIKRKRPYWTYSCDSCMACMNYCPHKAVEVSPLLAIIFYYLTTVPISTYLLGNLLPATLTWFPINLDGAIQYVYILTSVLLVYLILHTALGWRFFSMILSRFSHTHYLRRYHAPDITLKEINKR